MGKKSRRKKPAKARMPFVARTFEGLPGELDWIAMREFVSAATATVQTNDGRTVRVCSLLPGGGAGLVRPDGEIWLGLQVLHNHGDISRDLAHVLELAASTEPGSPIAMSDPGVGPRLQEFISADQPFEVEMHDGFDFWVDEPDENTAAALEQANEAVSPSRKLGGVDGAYVTRMGDHTFLRWVREESEDDLLVALGRLHVAEALDLDPDTRFIGIFRAHGLLVPVWELFGTDATGDPSATDSVGVESAVASFSPRLEAALASDDDITAEVRAARNYLKSRQVTIR